MYKHNVLKEFYIVSFHMGFSLDLGNKHYKYYSYMFYMKVILHL